MKKFSLKLLIATSIFSALCFVGVFIQIKMPGGQMVHLGNFFLIVASFVLPWPYNAIGSSIGMTLYDAFFYNDSIITILSTFILKFVLSSLAFLSFNKIFNKKRKLNILIKYIFILSIFILSYLIYFLKYSNNAMLLVIPPIVIILSICIDLIFSKKGNIYQRVYLSSLYPLIFNTFLSYIVLVIKNLINNKSGSFSYAINVSFYQIPASIITTLVTLILVVIIYPKLQQVLKNKNIIYRL